MKLKCNVLWPDHLYKFWCHQHQGPWASKITMFCYKFIMITTSKPTRFLGCLFHFHTFFSKDFLVLGHFGLDFTSFLKNCTKRSSVVSLLLYTEFLLYYIFLKELIVFLIHLCVGWHFMFGCNFKLLIVSKPQEGCFYASLKVII